MSVGGLSTYVFSGNGGGTITINTVGSSVIAIASGGIIDIAAGTKLAINNSGGSSVGFSSSNFTKTSPGTLIFNSYGTGGTSTSGTVTISDGTIQMDGNNLGQFTNQTINLTGAGSVFTTNMNSISSGGAGVTIQALIGTTGTVRSDSTGGTGGYIRLLGNTDTTFGGTLTDGASGGVLGLIKAGTGKMTLSNSANNQTGPVFVYAGILESTAAGAGSGKIVLGASARGTSRVFGTYQNTGSGTLDEQGTVAALFNGVIKGPNFTLGNLANQIQVLSGGIFQFDNSSYIPGTGKVLGGAEAGAILAAGYAVDNAFLNRISDSFSGTVALGADSSNNLDLSSATGINSANIRIGAVGGSRTYSGTITPNGNTYRLGGGNSTLTVSGPLVDVAGASSLDVGAEANYGQWAFAQVLNSTPDVLRYINLAGAGGLATASVSHVVLTSSDTFTGSTTVGPYSVLELSGSAGALAGTSGVTIRGGVLYLNTTGAANANANRISDSAGITVNQGGEISFRGTGSTTETVGSLALNSGQTYITTARDSGTSNATLAFGGFSRSTGATLRGNLSSSAPLVVTSSAPTPGGDNNALGGWAVANSGADWASMSSGTFGTISTYTTTAPSTWASTNNITMSVSANTTVSSGHQAVFSLKNTGGAGATLDLGGLSFQVNGGGILNFANNVYTIQNGTLTAGNAGGANYELFFWGYGSGRSITVASTATITDNGANPVAVVHGGNIGGDGTQVLTLSGSNSYSGGTYINQSAVAIADANSLGTGKIYFSSYHDAGVENGQFALAELQLAGVAGSRILANNIDVNADAYLYAPTANTWTTTGIISLNNNSTLRVGSGALTLNSQIVGTGGLSFTTSGTMGGASSNTYTGDTLVLGGSVILNKSSGNAIGGDLYLGGYSQSGGALADRMVQLNASNQIADTSLVTMVGGGTAGNERNILRMNGQTDTIGGLSSTLGNGIVDNALASTTGTLNISPAAGKSYSFGGLIQNGAGTGSVLKLVKSGAGTQTLTGTSTYTGGTDINGGTLVVSGSITGSVTTVSAGGTLASGANLTSYVKAVALTSNGAGGGTLAPGNVGGFGMLTVDGTLSMGTASTAGVAHLAITIGNTTAGTGYGQVTATGAVSLNNVNLDLTLNGYTANLHNATVDQNGHFLTSGDTFYLVLGSSITGQFANQVSPSFSDIYNTITIGSQEFAINYNAVNLGAFTSTGGNTIALMAIPEPQTWVMFFSGIGMLALMRRRRP